MWHDFRLDARFCADLEAIDLALAAAVRGGGCAHCAGPLHRADYPRKPRGGGRGEEGERWTRRISLCCGAEGCRRRATPPSVRFLGRRVYLGAVVVVVCAEAQEAGQIPQVGVPRRTVRRWQGWWAGGFLETAWWAELCGWLRPGAQQAAQPRGLLGVLKGAASERLRAGLRLLSPLTTSSVAGPRFVRVEG